MDLQHWQVRRDDNSYYRLIFNHANMSTNILSAAAMEELSQIIGDFERLLPEGIIIESGKSTGFIAGADIQEFNTLTSDEAVIGLLDRGWRLFNRLAALKCPTLALIHGHCLGGGLELAMACRYRIATDESSTQLGLPEVQLGILPAWGGMLRLPALIGVAEAFKLLLTGKAIHAHKARHLGLVDACVPYRLQQQAAIDWLRRTPKKRTLPIYQRCLHTALLRPFLRPFIARFLKRSLAKKVKEAHYPAPYTIVDCWTKYNGNALRMNAAIKKLVLSASTQNLLRIYHLRERLRRLGKTSLAQNRSQPSFEHNPDHAQTSQPSRFDRVHIIGAGTMGRDIAYWCLSQGLQVSLHDLQPVALKQAAYHIQQELHKRFTNIADRRDFEDRFYIDFTGTGVYKADLIIEAVIEHLSTKQHILQQVEQKASPQALMTTNTSSLSLQQLAKALQQPARLVGLHFFNPVVKMPLIEVIRSPSLHQANTVGEHWQQQALTWVHRLKKLPLPVNDYPGFVVNALLLPYLQTAMQYLDKHIAPEILDKAMQEFGMPMGPIELIDTIGLDIAEAVGKELGYHQIPKCLFDHLEASHLGRKTGKGFYRWHHGRPIKQVAGDVPKDLAEHLLQPMLDKAQQLLKQKVVDDADLLDAGLIFGAGFAPHTGGLLHSLNSLSK